MGRPGDAIAQTRVLPISARKYTLSAQSVTADVQRIRHHPLVPKRIAIYGYIYDVKTGKLVEVPEAIEAGKAQ
jgi:carbonic anhydrase